MSEKNTGGPAFPTKYPYTGGMTLRDHFAGLAMPILWDAYDKGYCGITVENEFNNELLAEGAYQIADAMLKAREQ